MKVLMYCVMFKKKMFLTFKNHSKIALLNQQRSVPIFPLNTQCILEERK